jgi:hypothetical protein
VALGADDETKVVTAGIHHRAGLVERYWVTMVHHNYANPRVSESPHEPVLNATFAWVTRAGWRQDMVRIRPSPEQQRVEPITMVGFDGTQYLEFAPPGPVAPAGNRNALFSAQFLDLGPWNQGGSWLQALLKSGFEVAGPQSVAGVSCLQLAVKSPRAGESLRCWVAPSCGYAVIKAASEFTPPGPVSSAPPRRTIAAFLHDGLTKYGQDLWLPRRVRCVCQYQTGAAPPAWAWLTMETVVDLHVNEDDSKLPFQRFFPLGVDVAGPDMVVQRYGPGIAPFVDGMPRTPRPEWLALEPEPPVMEAKR